MPDAIDSAAGRTSAVCFDLDGTLLRHTTVSEFLARRLGHEAMLHDLEARYAAGEISNAVVADATAAAFAGLAVDCIEGHLDAAPWMKHIGHVVGELRARGSAVLLGTVTWRFAAEYLGRRCGFDAVSGTVMGVRDGVLTGTVTRYCDQYDKVTFVREVCGRYGLDLRDVIAVGDSRSDVPLFAVVGHAIALNATADARAAADTVVDSDDLRSLLPLLRRATRPYRQRADLRDEPEA